MSESQLVANILKGLKLKGYWAFRLNSGATVIPGSGNNARRVISGAPAGTPDILVLLPPNGRAVGLEVKTATGVQRPTQVTWQAQANKHGVPYAIVRSFSDAWMFLRSVQGQSSQPKPKAANE